MANIPQLATASKGFNLQINIPELLKRELRSVTADLDYDHPRDVVIEALEHFLPMKRQQAKRLRDADATKANGKKR